MKLINQKHEIWKQGEGVYGMWEHIARCTRVCYQVENQRPNESAESFCRRTILRHSPVKSKSNHLAMAEHGTVYLTFLAHNHEYDFYTKNPYSKVVSDGNAYYVTTNLRVLIENDRLDDLTYIAVPSKHKRRITVSFITSVGISRELNRHRCHSISEESTRYCNYTKDRFGNELTLIIPSGADLNEGRYYMTMINEELYCIGDGFLVPYFDKDECKFIQRCIGIEEDYTYFILKKWSPQQARDILPLCLKTQVIHTAYADDWEEFFNLRTVGISGPPHPMMKELTKPLMKEFVDLGYIKTEFNKYCE